MSLATIDLKPGFIDRRLIAEQPQSGALVKIANPTNLDLVGSQVQTINFEGEMGIFGEGAVNATDAEKSKTSNDASNGSITITPITFHISYRFPKKFLQLFGVNGYNPSDPTFRAGAPQTMLNNIISQPYQAGILEQYQNYVNKAISRALDYVVLYGVNPKTGKASDVARVNGHLLASTGGAEKIDRTSLTPGNALRAAVAHASAQGDTAAQGVVTSTFLNDLGSAKTTIGSPAEFASNVPLIGSLVNVGGVTLAASNTVSDNLAAASAGAIQTGETLDGVFGDFTNRFVWGAIPLSGIEVFDSGNPDGSTEGDLGATNKVLLRTEVALGWGFLGGADKFAYVSHTVTAGD